MAVQILVVVAVLSSMLLAAPSGAPMVDRIEGALHFEATVSKKAFDPGEAVDVTFVIRNAGGAPVSLTFYSGQRFDLIVRRPRGDEVWRWSHDRAFTQVLQTVTLKPGEALPFRATWNQTDLQGRRVDPGIYELIAVFLARPEGTDRPNIALPPIQITIAR